MTTTATGRAAETAAAHFLEQKGLVVHAQNWRTRRCEIDIVASQTTRLTKRPKIMHFVEVKFRKSVRQGTGLDYITRTKLEQMHFAARTWVHENNWDGDYRLDVIGVSRQGNTWTFEYVENLSLD